MKPASLGAVLFLLAITMLPLGYSFNCNLVNDTQSCNDVLSSNLSIEEKDLLIAELLYSYKDVPNYNFVYDYNKNINVINAPENTPLINSIYIKNAWIKIFFITPSLIEDDKLFVNYSGKIFTYYNYDIEIPTQTSPGDCKTKYELIQNNSILEVYANNALIGNSKQTQFNIFEDTLFESKLNIDVTIKIDHYKKYKTCCKYEDGVCKKYCSECKYNYSETKKDNIVIKDSVNTYLYKEKPFVELKILNQYYGTIKGTINAGNYTYLDLSFDNSSIQIQKYVYTIEFSKKPYYIVTIRAIQQNLTKIHNSFYNNNTFYLPQFKSCNLLLKTHFESLTQDCNFTIEQEENKPFQQTSFSKNWNFLLTLSNLAFIGFLFYWFTRKYLSKFFITS